MPIIITIAFIIIFPLEIVVGFKTRNMLRGKVLLGIAVLHLLTPVIACISYLLFSSKQPVEIGLFYVVNAFVAECILGIVAFFLLIVSFTGLLTNRKKWSMGKSIN